MTPPTPRERAERIVKWFHGEGHPWYEKLVGPIADAIQHAVWDERGACAQIADREREASSARSGAGRAKQITAAYIANEIRARKDYEP